MSTASTTQLLVFTPLGKDAQHLCKVLENADYQCQPCRSVQELVDRISDSVIAIILTEEVFAGEMEPLVQTLRQQPTWSALPVLLFYTPRDGSGLFAPRLAASIGEFTDLTLLARPVSSLILLSTVRTMQRDRNRQHRTRDLLQDLQAELERRERQEKELLRARREADEARQAAENANRTKSEFLANMSHEIRTPLAAMMGFTDLIALPETPNSDRQSYLAVVRRNSKQLLRIIDDILDLSKVESGKMTFENIHFSLPELLDEAASLLRLRAEANGTRLQVHTPQNLPTWIRSDPTRLRQILLNVVGNAIKFTQEGCIDVYVGWEASGRLTFEVHDTGCGISPDQSQVLFRAFAQADSSTTRNFGGTGLGLVLTRRLCEAMGGEFFLQHSEVGKGSVFVARVQVEATDEKPQPFATHSRDGNTRPLDGMRILLVEDSPDNRELIRIGLTRAGAAVEVACDGVEGVEKASAEPFQIILLDIQMPRMDGMQAVHLLRRRGLEIPIIALTAHAMKEEEERCLAAGFSHFLAKPVPHETLVNLLESLRARTPGGAPL